MPLLYTTHKRPRFRKILTKNRALYPQVERAALVISIPKKFSYLMCDFRSLTGRDAEAGF